MNKYSVSNDKTYLVPEDADSVSRTIGKNLYAYIKDNQIVMISEQLVGVSDDPTIKGCYVHRLGFTTISNGFHFDKALIGMIRE